MYAGIHPSHIITNNFSALFYSNEDLSACTRDLPHYGNNYLYKMTCRAPGLLSNDINDNILQDVVSELSFIQHNATSCNRSHVVEFPGATGTHGMQRIDKINY